MEETSVKWFEIPDDELGQVLGSLLNHLGLEIVQITKHDGIDYGVRGVLHSRNANIVSTA